MAAGACQLTSLRVVQSHGGAATAAAGAALEGRAYTRATPSLGARCVGLGLNTNLSTTVQSRQRQRIRENVKFVASAVAEEAVSASEADSVAESLSMYFKAEGSLNENAVSKVTKILEGTEGVSKIKVTIDEGAATIELVKLTNIQATGVASSLVEIIEQAGFKMQALSLGFDDDDTEDDEFIDYDASSFTEEVQDVAEEEKTSTE